MLTEPDRRRGIDNIRVRKQASGRETLSNQEKKNWGLIELKESTSFCLILYAWKTLDVDAI